MAQINCHRYTFVDACNSGKSINNNLAGTKVNASLRSKTLTQLIETQPNLYSIMSCGREELSWEDSTWTNGAFTEAILEVFANSSEEVGDKKIHADVDNNKIITIEELYTYLKKRIPHLVNSVICQRPNIQARGACDIRQTPFMQKEQANSLLPFILLK